MSTENRKAKTVKTAELTGAALDWAVLMCEGMTGELGIIDNKRSGKIEIWDRGGIHTHPRYFDDGKPMYLENGAPVGLFGNPAEVNYSNDWAIAGPIIEREKITIGPVFDRDGKTTGKYQAFIGWNCEFLEPHFELYGNTQLIASMRCYVASKLGDAVEIPSELI